MFLNYNNNLCIYNHLNKLYLPQALEIIKSFQHLKKKLKHPNCTKMYWDNYCLKLYNARNTSKLNP